MTRITTNITMDSEQISIRKAHFILWFKRATWSNVNNIISFHLVKQSNNGASAVHHWFILMVISSLKNNREENLKWPYCILIRYAPFPNDNRVLVFYWGKGLVIHLSKNKSPLHKTRFVISFVEIERILEKCFLKKWEV